MENTNLEKPKITLYKNCNFTFNSLAAEIMELKPEDRLMAFFNYAKKRVCLKIDEDPDENSIRVTRSDGYVFRFSNSSLRTRIVNCFDLRLETNQVFEVVKTNKGFQIIPVD